MQKNYDKYIYYEATYLFIDCQGNLIEISGVTPIKINGYDEYDNIIIFAGEISVN